MKGRQDNRISYEVVRFHHRDHTSAFWNEVDKIMPQYMERKEWLRKWGVRLAL